MIKHLIYILTLAVFTSCTLSNVTPEQEEKIVGTYYLLVTDELLSLYPDEHLENVTLEMKKRGYFSLANTPLIKGSEDGKWLLLDEASIPYMSFNFNSGKQEQVTYSIDFDTLRVINPKAIQRGKEIKEIIFVKDNNQTK